MWVKIEKINGGLTVQINFEKDPNRRIIMQNNRETIIKTCEKEGASREEIEKALKEANI